MLSADFGHLERDTRMVDASAAEWVHIDVMDGVFVPNISFGFPVLKAIRKATAKFLDVHLMIVSPEKYVARFAEAGADLVTFHLEATDDPAGCVALIRRAGAKAGVSIKPATPVEALREVIAGAGVWAGAVYFALQMMTVIIAPIPSNISMMAGALALGFWPAMILGVLAVIAGSVIVFLAARALGRNAVQRFLDKGVMEKYLPIIEEKQDMFLFLTMLFPFFPDDALCMLAGLTKIPLGRFVAIMALARPWGLIVAALLGSGALSLPVWAWAVIGGAGLLIFVFAMKYSAQIEEALLGLVRRIVPKRNRSDRN